MLCPAVPALRNLETAVIFQQTGQDQFHQHGQCSAQTEKTPEFIHAVTQNQEIGLVSNRGRETRTHAKKNCQNSGSGAISGNCAILMAMGMVITVAALLVTILVNTAAMAIRARMTMNELAPEMM